MGDNVIPVVYCGPSDEVWLPEHEIAVSRAAETGVPDAVAGREPGPWRPADPQEITPGGGWTPDGWPLHLGDDGIWLTRDPGSGLLAQEGTWARPGTPEARAALQREIEHLERLKSGLPPAVAVPADDGQED